MIFFVFLAIFLFSKSIFCKTLKIAGESQGLGIVLFHLSVPTVWQSRFQECQLRMNTSDWLPVAL